MMKLTHEDHYFAKSEGFVIEDDGKVYMAFNHLAGTTNFAGNEQLMLLGSWDSTANTMNYMV